MRIATLPQHPSFSQRAFLQNYRYILNKQIKFGVSDEYVQCSKTVLTADSD